MDACSDDLKEPAVPLQQSVNIFQQHKNVVDLKNVTGTLTKLEALKAENKTNVLGAGEFGHILAGKHEQGEEFRLAGCGDEVCVKVPYFQPGMEQRV